MTYRSARAGVTGRADALAQKDIEIARCEELYRGQAVDAASHLVARFAHQKRPESAYTLDAEDI